MLDVNKNVEDYNPSRKCNILIVFDDVIADVISNKKIDQIVVELLEDEY